MPSLDHEVLLLLFRNRPALAAELLRDALGQALPAYEAAELHDADLSQAAPTAYHADLVVVLRGSAGPLLGIVVEVQLGRDEDKRYSWPLYLAALRARLRCPCCVLVVAPNEGVGHWARRPVALGPGSSRFAPLVIDPARVPFVADAARARAAPELAVLSAHAHGDGPDGLPVVLAALEAAAGLEHESAMLYCDLIWRAAGAALRSQLEELMQTGGYTYQSDFAKRYLAQGKAEGRIEGEAQALLRILGARALSVSDAERAQIMGCADLATVEAWLDRALTAASVAEVLAAGR